MFTGSFSVSQDSNITGIIITDTSSYTSEGQGTFSGRRIYLYKIDGTTLIPAGNPFSYIDFPFTAGASITIAGVLTTDYALAINVLWLSNSPQPGSTYTLTTVNGFIYYLPAFLSTLIGTVSGNPGILRDTSWYFYLGALQTEIDNSIKSVDDGQQFSAQQAIDRGTYLMNNQNDFF